MGSNNQSSMKKKYSSYALAAFLVAGLFATPVFASTTLVTPTDTQGWSTSDTRLGGAVNYVTDATSPYPDGALQLTTDGTNEAKAQYLKGTASDTTLASVTELSYSAKQVEGPVHADASYQLLVDLNGAATGGFTTFVYEPYQNGTVTPGVWQQWHVDAGQMWSSRSFSEGACTVISGAGGAPFYTLAGLQTSCPDAVVLGFGVNVGTYNPGYNVYVDGVTFNGDVYNFEVTAPVTQPTSSDQCKKDGYKSFSNPTYKNQGQCVSAVKSNK